MASNELPPADDETLSRTDENSAAGSPGQGELLIDPHRNTADCRLIGRAFRSKWNIDSATKAIVVNRLRAIASGGDPRRAVEACRALIAADGIDVSADRPAPHKTVQNLTQTIVASDIASLSPEQLRALSSAHRALSADTPAPQL